MPTHAPKNLAHFFWINLDDMCARALIDYYIAASYARVTARARREMGAN